MATIANTTNWAPATINNTSALNKLATWADKQAPNRTMWFMVALIAQGVLFLPLPAVLLYYFNAPVLILAVTLGLFFSNIIAGMGGAGIRTLLAFFAVSILANLTLLLIFAL
ncbi:hypothetical protein D0C36_23915 [Mucilaginibacter conchicola]|uniref:Uncharacterized protein n=1 Tax=Mucilaginibacter conchicola TaxID=2303333 RepID=A0A372NNI4_9SPHI|nr:hypothetical protein [Mucilaginibacter conchicola]RFZ89945.1 hypothetical protein D0C36_23915 [Mucilaginibacter conchicola]